MKQIIFFIGFFLLPFFCLAQNNFFGNSIQSGFELKNKSIAVKIGDATFVPADVVKTATKQLIFGSAGYEVMFFGNTMLRIVGYPATGQNTDLYKVKEKVYRDVDNTFILRLR